MKNVITIFLFLFLCSFIHTGLAGADLIGPQRLENNANWTGGFYNGSRKGEIQWAVELEGEKCIRIIGQENGVVGYVMLKDFVPVESGRHLLFDYKGHSSIDNAHVQIRFYNQQRKEISKYVIKSKVTEGQWFILSKLKGQALFMGMDEEGSYQKGPRMSIANANSLPVPPYAAWARIFFLIDNISVLSLTDVVLRQKQLTAEEKDLREEQERLLLKFQEAVPRRPQERQAGFAISSEEIELPRVSKPLPDKWPLPKVEVRHGCFLLDGEPTYLTGAEAEATLTPFWYKLLGLDFVQHTTAYLINSAKISKNENGAHFTWTKPYADLTLGVRELLNHGLLPYVQMIEGSPDHLEKRLKLKEQAPDLMVDFGHFYGLRHDNEDAWTIRKNYFKNNLSALTDYPIFAIETFNEVMFIDGGAKAIERFRRWCQKKYGNIAWLNQVWRSDFESFDKIEPPLVAGWTYSFTNLPRHISRMMWRDWGEFSSLNSQEAFRKTYDLVKKYRPDTMVTVQSTAAFFYDHIFCGVSAESKSKAEDIYGDEVGIRYTTMSPGKENPLKVSAMLRGVLWIDYLAHLLPEQAQLSEECAASTNYMDIGEELQVIKLHDDQWRFKADNENQGSEKTMLILILPTRTGKKSSCRECGRYRATPRWSRGGIGAKS